MHGSVLRGKLVNLERMHGTDRHSLAQFCNLLRQCAMAVINLVERLRQLIVRLPVTAGAAGFPWRNQARCFRPMHPTASWYWRGEHNQFPGAGGTPLPL